jgi:hypothetical protein
MVMAYELEDELEALGELEDEDEGELEEEGEWEDEAGLEGEGWLGAIGNIASSLLGEEEGESEEEFELSPIRKVYPDAMMEHLGELAAEAETEDEAAEHFLPLIGMAASKLLPVVAKAVAPAAKKMLPRVARAVTKAAPHLTRSIGKVARKLHRNPQTRHLLKVVPTIARRTVGSIARQAAGGRPITPGTAVHTLARQARKVLVHPRHRRHALRHHHRLERHFHHRYGPVLARPHPAIRAAAHGTAGVTPVHGSAASVGRGRIVGGQCVCGGVPVQHAPAPAYCRCCGQIIR